MKKLLSILAAIGVTAVAAVPVVSCSVSPKISNSKTSFEQYDVPIAFNYTKESVDKLIADKRDGAIPTLVEYDSNVQTLIAKYAYLSPILQRNLNKYSKLMNDAQNLKESSQATIDNLKDEIQKDGKRSPNYQKYVQAQADLSKSTYDYETYKVPVAYYESQIDTLNKNNDISYNQNQFLVQALYQLNSNEKDSYMLTPVINADRTVLTVPLSGYPGQTGHELNPTVFKLIPSKLSGATYPLEPKTFSKAYIEPDKNSSKKANLILELTFQLPETRDYQTPGQIPWTVQLEKPTKGDPSLPTDMTGLSGIAQGNSIPFLQNPRTTVKLDSFYSSPEQRQKVSIGPDLKTITFELDDEYKNIYTEPKVIWNKQVQSSSSSSMIDWISMANDINSRQVISVLYLEASSDKLKVVLSEPLTADQISANNSYSISSSTGGLNAGSVEGADINAFYSSGIYFSE